MIHEETLINQIAHRLERFKWEGHRSSHGKTAKCRCIVCGDSQRNKSKARFYFIPAENGYRVYCHNCGYSESLRFFIKEYFPEFYGDYAFDRLKKRLVGDEVKETVKLEPIQKKEKVLDFPEWFKLLTPLDGLPKDHKTVQYALKRNLGNHLDKLFFIDDFSKLQSICPERNMDFAKNDSNRMILVCRSFEGVPFGVIGRSILPDEPLRYLNLKSSEWEGPLCYGLDRVDSSKETVVLEGAIDSLHLPNAIAVNSSALANVSYYFYSPNSMDNFIFFFDQQPRNREICGLIENAIDRNLSVVLLPEHVREKLKAKDVDEMVRSITPEEIMELFRKHCVHGATAVLVFKIWKRFQSSKR